MTLNEIKEILRNYDDEIILLEKPSYETAIIGIDSNEFIDYNTIRTLPYMGDKAPIIKRNLI